MKTSELLLRLLGISENWNTKSIKMDHSHKRLHIWLLHSDATNTKEHSGGAQTCESCATKSQQKWNDQEVSWFHVGLGSYGTKLYSTVRQYGVPCGKSQCQVGKSNLGNAELGVTDALAYRIIELLSKGAAYSSVCKLFNIPLQTVWAIREQFDSGKLNLDVAKQASEENESITSSVEGGLSNLSDEIWMKLLAKDSGFVTKSLSLKFMLTKIRTQIKNMNNDGSQKIKIGELRRFFDKHQRVLKKEIAQLHAWGKEQ